MRLKYVLTALAASLLALTSCQEEPDLGRARITVSPSDVLMAQGDGITMTSITATRDWRVKSKPDWLALNREKGEASVDPQMISISVMENDGYNRTGEIVFTINLAKAHLVVKQLGPLGERAEGSGTKEDPYTVYGVVKFLNGMAADVNSDYVYVKGKVSSIVEAFATQFGNSTFYISDDGSAVDVQFQVFRALYLGNKKWTASDPALELGDDVIIYGKVVNYKGNTPETAQGTAFVYEHKGVSKGGDEGQSSDYAADSGDGTQANPYNAAAAFHAASKLAADATSATDVYVKAKVAEVGEVNLDYGNATYTVADDGHSGTFSIYRGSYINGAKFTSADQLAAGDEVVIVGKLVNYRGNTPQMNQGSKIVSKNGSSDSGETSATPSGTGTESDPLNVAAAIEKAKTLTWTANDNFEKVGPFYIKGKISKITNAYDANFGTARFDIVDEGYTATFTAYSVLFLGNRNWVEGDIQIAVGDEVVIHTEIQNYHGDTPETVSGAYLYKLNGSTEGVTQPVIRLTSFRQTLAGFTAGFVTNQTGNLSWKLYANAVEGSTPVATGQVAAADNSITGTYASYQVGTTYLLTLSNADGSVVSAPMSFVARDLSAGGEEEFTIDLTSATTWTAATDATYGAGFSASAEGFSVGFYKHEGTTTLLTPGQSLRLYKKSVFVIEPPAGKTIKKVLFNADPVTSNGTSYVVDLTVILPADGGKMTADKTANTIGPWEGSATKFVAQAVDAQARLKGVVITIE